MSEDEKNALPTFMESMREQVIKDTWGNNLPMIYANDKKEVVKHYRDGKIEVMFKLNEDGRKD